MAPKSDRNKSNPEKHAEVNENWANNLPLKYDDHACIERNEIIIFAEQLSDSSWTEKQPATAEVLTKLRTFWTFLPLTMMDCP